MDENTCVYEYIFEGMSIYVCIRSSLVQSLARGSPSCTRASVRCRRRRPPPLLLHNISPLFPLRMFRVRGPRREKTWGSREISLFFPQLPFRFIRPTFVSRLPLSSTFSIHFLFFLLLFALSFTHCRYLRGSSLKASATSLAHCVQAFLSTQKTYRESRHQRTRSIFSFVSSFFT